MKQYYFLRACSFFLLMFFGISIGQAKTVKYTIFTRTSVTSSGDIPSGSSAVFVNTYTSNKLQMTADNSMTLTLTGFDSKTITGITMYMASNKATGSGSFNMTCGTTQLASISDAPFNNTSWAGKWPGSQVYVNISPAVTSYAVGSNEQIVINISASESSLYCQYFTITYEDPGVAKTPTVTSFGAGAQNSYDAFIGEGFTAPTATVDNSGTVTYGSSSTSVATVDPNTGAVTLVAPGSTTITASYAGDATYAPSSASYTLNVGKVYNNMLELQAGATTTSTLAKIKLDGIIVTGVKGSNAYISDGEYGAMIYTSNHGLNPSDQLDGTLVANVVLYNGATEITNFNTNGVTISDGYLVEKNTGIYSITLANQSKYIELNDVVYNASNNTFTAYGSLDQTSITYYDGLAKGYTFVDGGRYHIKGIVGYFNKLQLFPVSVSHFDELIISNSGYATYVAKFNFDPVYYGMEAYTVNVLDGSHANLTPVTLVPAGAVVVLKGDPLQYFIEEDKTDTFTPLTGNELVASTTDVIADGSQYILAMPAGSPVGFYRANSGTTIYAGKGYLSIPLPPTAKFLGFTFDTTGIDKVNAYTENNVIYNLNGQKISAPVKGVNIINGKKVVVK